MTATTHESRICGHSWDALFEALAIYDATPEWELGLRETMSLSSAVGVPIADLRAAFNDCNDPAKLVEMIIDDGGRLDVEIGPFVGHGGPEWMVWVDGDAIIIDGCTKDTWRMRRTMPQARAILAALLQIPDGAREAAEKVLRGETCE